MTNEEAIQFLSQIMDALLASNSWLPSTDNPIKESFDMAISALTAQPEKTQLSEEDATSDCISRQAAIDVIDKIFPADPMRNDYTQGITCGAALATEYIKQLPSAQPETAKRIVGKSRDGMTLWYQCDMCNEPVDVQDNFCRGCGRRLTDE